MKIKTFVALLILVGAVLAAVLPVAAQDTSPAPTALTASTNFYATANFRANVRSGPSIAYTILGTLNPGDSVDITGRSNEDADWLRVNFKGQEGWVIAFAVDVTGSADDAPIVEPGSNAVLIEPGTLGPGAETATRAPLTASTEFFATARFRANVRSGPGVIYTITGQLFPEDEVDITGRESEDNDWLRIDFNSTEGWVSFNVVNVTGDPDDAPVVEPGPNAALRTTTGQAGAQSLGEVQVVTQFNANLRTDFSTDADVIAVIPFGTQLTGEARTENANWIRVTFEGQTGWISSGLLNFVNGNTATLPVVDAS